MHRAAGRRFIGLLALLIPVSLARGQDPDYLSIVTSYSDLVVISQVDQYNPAHPRTTKYTCPAGDDPALVPCNYMNVNLFITHLLFLQDAFPEEFGSMTLYEYASTMGFRLTRRYFTGWIFAYDDGEGGHFYGFDFYEDPGDPTGPMRADEILPLYNRLAETFLLRPLYYMPHREYDIQSALLWGDNVPFPITFPETTPPPQYSAYTTGTNYGRVRVLSPAEFDLANATGDLNWQDILVLETVPFDIQNVIAGLVTAQPQSELSHVTIRMGLRQTPNAYAQNASDAFAAIDGRLVRLEINRDGYVVIPDVDPAEAEAWWDAHRPRLEGVHAPDTTYDSLDSLTAMNLDTDPTTPVLRYGGKATNLGRLYRFLPARYQVPGFAIPFRYYREFMESNLITDSSVSPPQIRTYQEYIESLLANPQFRSDSRYRASRLGAFREYASKNAIVDPALVSQVAAKIATEFGGTDVMVRFRSSSNIEDSLEFNGAGLYESTSVCADDTFDGDELGPSHCNPNEPDERTIERGLVKVWTSLWRPQAFEEREYYQVPQELAGMAILVTLAFPDEASNGVAFTGDPTLGASGGFVINVMPGDISVVSPPAGQLPEKDVVHVVDGRVERIVRSHASSLMPPGEWVLSEDQLTSLGLVLDFVRARYPVDLQGHDPDTVLLDLEFKFTQAGELILKQIRPFLVAGGLIPNSPLTHRIVVPETTFLYGRPKEPSLDTVAEDMSLLSRIEFTSGTLILPTDLVTTGLSLVRSFVIGPAEQEAVPAGPSRLVPSRADTFDVLDYTESFAIPGATIDLTAQFHLPAAEADHTLDEALLRSMPCTAEVRFEGGGTRTILFGPPAYTHYPIYTYRLRLADGRVIILRCRYMIWYINIGPVAFLSAHVVSPENTMEQQSYFRLFLLTDTSFLERPTFFIRYDAPIDDVYGLMVREETADPPTYRVCELDADLQCIRDLEVVEAVKIPAFDPAYGFILR